MEVPERTDRRHVGPVVGIVGAGQLARMLCEAASELGIDTVVLAADAHEAAVDVAGEVLLGSATDAGALGRLARSCEVLTFDHELVDLDALAVLEAAGVSVRPSPRALLAAVDKAFQRRDFSEAGLPVPEFVVLEGTLEDDLVALRTLATRLGRVPVVKAARGGYDGHGVLVASSIDAAEDAVRRWRADDVAVVAEAPCAFKSELAVLVARRPDGEAVAWRAVETAQVDGMCREVRVPGNLDDATASAAGVLARRVASHLGVVGVLAVELFDGPDGLLVNEVALRPHNSGHWTIEGATTSQFENHLRAVLDLPLGATDLLARAVTTVNILGGTREADRAALMDALSDPAVKVHLYGKSHRRGRKLGHVTVTGDDPDDVTTRAWRAAAALGTPVAVRTGGAS